MAHKKSLDIEESSGNVFADIDMPNSEEYLAKAKLAYQINQIIKNKKLTPIDAATLLGIDKLNVLALANGRLSDFSLEKLFRFLTILNQDIVIMVKPHSEDCQANSAHIFVRYTEA